MERTLITGGLNLLKEFLILHIRMKFSPVIRNDDVFQTYDTLTGHQLADLAGRSLFQSFKEADKVFARYGYPCTLACLADGLRDYPKWVRFVKRQKERYDIQLH